MHFANLYPNLNILFYNYSASILRSYRLV